MICLWCGVTLGPNTFAIGDRVFCSGKCARYYTTAPITKSATFFEDARAHLSPMNLSRLVSTCAVARQNGLDSALSAIRAYQLAVAAEGELPETDAARRRWCETTVARLGDVWRELDAVRWDYGPVAKP